jgi:hypothetical protein
VPAKICRRLASFTSACRIQSEQALKKFGASRSMSKLSPLFPMVVEAGRKTADTRTRGVAMLTIQQLDAECT